MVETIKQRYGQWALVTGASSGIGECFARQLAEAGLNIVLLARREDRLNQLAQSLSEEFSVSCRIAAIDLSSDDFMTDLLKTCADIEISLLVNNAGFSVTGEFVENELDRELSMLYTNCRAPLLLTHHFAKGMKERQRGGIIFVSSIAGFNTVPNWSNYSATKGYDLLLGEGLYHELKPFGVDVSVICPGETRSEFHQTAELEPFMLMEPERVAKVAIQSLGHRRTAVPGVLNNVWIGFTKWMPRKVGGVGFGMVIKYLSDSKKTESS